jgi:hypothetical protein
MESVKFTETIFKNKGKKGILTPDSDGYYTLVIGALNTYNSAGEYYTAQEALSLFEGSSQLMRRIKNGALYSELGHPKKDSGMSMETFYNRVLTIDENNVCAHISDITLDFNYGKKNPSLNNPNLIAIIGKIKPAGIKAPALESALANSSENVAFSVRGLTENKLVNGVVNRTLTNIITWDYVIEPGIAVACKAYSPAVEARSNLTEIQDVTIDKAILTKVLKDTTTIIATESDRLLRKELLSRLETKQTKSKLSQW